jgi:hypothetical protein
MTSALSLSRLAGLCLATAAAALLSACGGGSDPLPLPAEPAAATVPDSALASVRAYTEFAGALIADDSGSESAAPLLLNAGAAPVSESASPLPVS